MSQEELNGEGERNRRSVRKKRLGRREMLRRLMATAGAVGTAASLPAATHAAPSAPTESTLVVPASDPGQAADSTMALGSAQPPDAALTAQDWRPKFFDDHQDQTVLAVADVLIPETDTPGAKAAQVDRFIDLLLATEGPGSGEETDFSDFADSLHSASTLETGKRYLEALNWLDGYCLAHYAKPFTGLDRPAQEAVLALLTLPTGSAETGRGRALFSLVKSSIVESYYSSEIGSVQELKYQTNPYQTGMPSDCDSQKN